MWKFIALLSLLIVYAEGNSEGPDIVNGVEAKEDERPYQVSLQELHYHFCGGSLISEYYIITAAHCTVALNETIYFILSVAAGMLDIDKPSQRRQFAWKMEHQDYNPEDSYRNDIALVKVSEAFTFDDHVKAVTLPKPHLKVPNDTDVVLSGWGSLGGKDNKMPKFLQVVTIQTVDQETCKKLIEVPGSKSHVYDTNICAYNPKERSGQCTHDSGGPLTWKGTQVGLVSWSYKDPYCASTKKPGLFTRVSEFIDWINENTK